MMLCLSLRDIAFITVKNADTTKSEAIHLLKNPVLGDRGYI